MAEAERPQIYLITPPVFELGAFTETLKAVLDAHEIACLRLSLAERDEDSLSRAGDALREVTHARDVPIVVENHVLLAGRLGLDGVHLTDTRKNIRKMRDEMGADAIIGAYCGITRHDGMNAAEAGADYVSFGPVGASTLGDGHSVDFELFEWWSAMIEVPVVAEGALTVELVEKYGPVTDFFGVGTEIWATEDASAALKALLQPLG
ncbi:thiamine phosphate synthase [Pseudorhodobacter turbinis]|uniref:Thiamine phosphate synthase n=1 Tax=Pseudorhodobacter turbinis TaxID=2500533 RepID=A0A4P8EHK0_9RHOB|nr:thiamine phosphate synthase [Pseudorhodobacter turbinis]QCO56045.1 thiamine phosphate synthase [Pseudorhodobacter turbinis]